MINLNAWFQKHGLCAENILYIYRKDRKTVIQRTDGAEFALFVPVHSVLSTLPEKNFLSISKGIVVCRSHIVNISNDGVYTMSDGRTFQGRKRDMSSHRRLRAEIELTNTKHRPLSMLEKCSLLDNIVHLEQSYILFSSLFTPYHRIPNKFCIGMKISFKQSLWILHKSI